MIGYSDFHYYWVVFEIINGIFISILSAIDIYIFIRRKADNSPLVAWAVDSKGSSKNFSILISSALLFIVVFIVYSFGVVSSNNLIKSVAELLGSVSYLMVSYVITSWSKVFMRFI